VAIITFFHGLQKIGPFFRGKVPVPPGERVGSISEGFEVLVFDQEIHYELNSSKRYVAFL